MSKVWVFGDSYSTPYNKLFMNNLWIFGPSYSTPLKEQIDYSDWAQRYCEWKGYIPLIYSQILASEFSLELSSFASGGLDNYTILERICENIEFIKENDVLIVGWSLPNRFRMVDDSGKDISIIGNFYQKQQRHFKFVSSTTLEEVLVNRDQHSRVFEYEMYQWTKLINKATNCKIIYLKWDSYPNYQTISEETNKEIDDKHFSENGHIQLANDIKEILLENKERINYLGNFVKTKKGKKLF